MSANPFYVLDLQTLRTQAPRWRIEYYEEISSTNDRALALANQSADDFVVVVAERQTAGRGRGPNRWWSAEGSLAFSLLVRPTRCSLPQRHWPLASLMTGLAVRDALDELAPNLGVQLKWPNDVYAQAKKICGILIEASPGDALVVGVGVNVNNSFAQADDDLRSIGASLRDLTGETFDLATSLSAALRHFERRLRQLSENRASLLEDWRAHCLLAGRHVIVDTPSERIEGVCQGIDQEGALLVETNGGRTRCVAGVVAEWR